MAIEANLAGARAAHRVRTPEERARAFRSAKRHSWLVRILRKVLPVVAVLVLAAYFVSTRMNVHVGGIAASIDGMEIANGALRMLNPTLKGKDEENGDYVIKADYADQDVANPNLIDLNTIKADVNNSSAGTWSKMRAVRGKFDSKAERLILKDHITFETSTGVTGELSYATLDMKKQILRSHNPVKLDLPNGTVRSNAMTLRSGENTIVFRGGVKVHLDPQKGKDQGAAVQAPPAAASPQAAAPVAEGAAQPGALQ
ncbi:LPS export ABC transporter periplasmic protein LptC [Methyloceanibacter sp.]|uniref:LPS export ABC transporter periplasmic protein LptC n=1 Tax=Methyloceanibacter sp. TaxID=1965321 RepID=UPI002CD3BD6A|nr:LPS export ABC transporter periplasmic protein LptC [Methyloceanibacter sp.]HML91432.1 LPS export ABC transporter periplasmic protein LptC [Methyloceanibacter sp.]